MNSSFYKGKVLCWNSCEWSKWSRIHDMLGQLKDIKRTIIQKPAMTVNGHGGQLTVLA